MANIFTSLLRELPWFEDDREAERNDKDSEDRAEQAELRRPKPYVPKSKPDHWLPS